MAEEKAPKKSQAPAKTAGAKVAIILVRGLINISKDKVDTLKMLKLTKKNSCVIYSLTPSLLGMIKKVEDYVTWGEIDAATLAELEKKSTKSDKKVCYNLQPPRKGFGRKGIKQPFNKGGALGKRGAKINDLIQRMI